jgi:hypothetical protein
MTDAYAGAERPRCPRSPDNVFKVIGRARPRAHRARSKPEAGEWFPVLDRHPEVITPEARPSHVWVDKRVERAWVEHLEVEEHPPNRASVGSAEWERIMS